MNQWPDGAPSPIFPLNKVYKRITVTLTDTLALHQDRKTAMAEITGNMGDHVSAEAGEGDDFVAHIENDVMFTPAKCLNHSLGNQEIILKYTLTHGTLYESLGE